MTKKIFLVALVAFVLTAPAFAEQKAVIWKEFMKNEFYLIDPCTREKLSEGYKKISAEKNRFIGYRDGDKVNYLLYIEYLDLYTGEPIPSSYHRIYQIGNMKENLLIGELGAMKYILDPATGKRQSSGYHKIYYREDLLIGDLGSLKYILDPKTKRRASIGFDVIGFQTAK
ncbi:MAG: hypothetical protein V1690_01330 [Candidatus Moraniibacteriota bacterium]